MTASRTTRRSTPRIALLISPFAIIAFVAVLSFAGTPSASAATITVNTQSDANPPVDDGLCSLREAIFNANEGIFGLPTYDDCPIGAGEDTIVFEPAVTMITLADDLEAIRDVDGLTVDGNDTVTVSGDGQYSMFIADTNVPLTLQDITLTNGKSAIGVYGKLDLESSQVLNSNGTSGGGIGIYQGATAVIRDSTISGNSALSGSGGAIYNEGHTTITNSIVQGNNASMNGGDIYSFGLGSLTINDSTIAHGTADAGGGGIYNDGAILQLNDSTVSDNMAVDNGGGIFTQGPATLDGSTVSRNTAGYGAGIYNEVLGTLIVKNDSHVDSNIAGHDGGGIFNLASLTVSNDSSVNLNQAAAYGGGINNSGNISIASSTVSFNSAPNAGGGIASGDSVDGHSTIGITASTLAGNATNGQGGGIESLANGTAITILRSTLNDNTAMVGGGIFQDAGTAAISNSTFSHNTAQAGAAIYNGANNNTSTLTNATVTANIALNANTGGAIYSPQANPNTINLRNTIVADQNAGTDCEGPGFVSLGNNLDSDNKCGLDQASDRPQANVFLGPLANNGGQTKTHALLANSEAIDGGNDAVCAASPISGKDQRGVSRPGGPHCDIGAYEFIPPATPTPTSGPTPAPTPTGSAVQQTELWGDNDCSGGFDTNDIQRGLLAVAAPDLLEAVSECPDMGEELQFIDAHPAMPAHLIWGDVHCGDGLNGGDVLEVLRHVAALDPNPPGDSSCPHPGDVVVFARE